MIIRICFLLEALSVIMCLHYLYDEKFKLDIKTLSFLAIDMILMTTIYSFELSQTFSAFIYPIIIGYCGVRFGFCWKTIIINNILYMIIVSLTQYVMIFITYIVCGNNMNDVKMLFINLCTLVAIICGFSRCKLKRISLYFHDEGRILVIALSGSIGVILYCLMQYKQKDGLNSIYYALLFLCVFLISILAISVGRYKIKAKEIEIELKMYELYEKSFRGLIENIRLRQHEFDNHINTIYSQHVLCNTYEELVDMQKDYCKILEKDNYYNKLLRPNNHMIRGFLYGKFMEIDKLGINILYNIQIGEIDIKIPEYKIVEILGDLINNAAEALEEENEKKLYVSIETVEESIEIEVRNVSRFISNKDLSTFFEKGYSKKGENRGLGLYNVKKICDDYGYAVMCTNKTIDDVNWLSFLILKNRNHLT